MKDGWLEEGYFHCGKSPIFKAILEIYVSFWGRVSKTEGFLRLP